MNQFFITFLILPILLICAPFSHAKMNGKDVIKKVTEKYDGLTNLKADFKQTFEWELAEQTQTVSGTIYLRAGDNYRVETEDQLIITDGKTVWTYSKKDNQVIIDLMEKSQENPLPKDLLFKYSKDYNPTHVEEEKLDDNEVYVVLLLPKDENEAFIKSMKIWVDAKTWFTRKIEQVDINDNINTYTVSNIQEGIELASDLFKFEIPDTTEVVDLRENE